MINRRSIGFSRNIHSEYIQPDVKLSYYSASSSEIPGRAAGSLHLEIRRRCCRRVHIRASRARVAALILTEALISLMRLFEPLSLALATSLSLSRTRRGIPAAATPRGSRRDFSGSVDRTTCLLIFPPGCAAERRNERANKARAVTRLRTFTRRDSFQKNQELQSFLCLRGK